MPAQPKSAQPLTAEHSAFKLTGLHLVRECAGTREKETLDSDDVEKYYVKACAAAPAGAKVIVQNTQRVGPYDELFYTAVVMNNISGARDA